MHPYHKHMSHKVEKSRAHRIAGGRLSYAKGGAVHTPAEEDDSFESDRSVASDHVHERQRHLQTAHPSRSHGGHVGGKGAKHRMDRKARKAGGRAHGDEAEDRALFKKMMKEEHHREGRAHGGRTKKKGGKHVTNVIIGPQGGGAHPMPVPVGGPPMGAAMPPRPPMAPPPGPPPGGPPPGLGGPPGMPPPPMGMRKRGGRVGVRDQGPGDHMPEQPPGWRESAKHKTPVQHTDGKDDGKDIGRGPVITKARGGKVKGVSVAVPPAPVKFARGGGVARGTSVAIKPTMTISDPVSRAVHQADKAPNNVSRAVKPAPPFGVHAGMAGGKSGVARLQKAHAAHGGNAP